MAGTCFSSDVLEPSTEICYSQDRPVARLATFTMGSSDPLYCVSPVAGSRLGEQHPNKDSLVDLSNNQIGGGQGGTT